MFRSSSINQIRNLSRTSVFQTSFKNPTFRMASSTRGDSKVPESVQKKVPKDVQEAIPDQVHPTKGDGGQSTNKTHAKGGGADSIVPQKIQEKLPESIERAVPNVIHNTGD
ncbi:hypothetical protein E4U49_002849 [Claviceps purpurea]|nr:hypothetical protein E4U49_002849 [Claviceps purpurea]